MSVKKLFAVCDKKASLFWSPMPSVSDGVAIRAFSDAVVSEQSELSRHAGDFALYQVGEFDESAGLLIPLVPPRYVADAVEFLPSKVGSSSESK